MAVHAVKFLKRVQNTIEKMEWKDIAVLKIDIIFFTLLVVHFWPELAQAHWAWYLIAVICCEAYLFQKLQIWKLLKSKNSHKKSDDLTK